MSQFRYFPTFPAGARLGAAPCGLCGKAPTIPARHLESISGGQSDMPICADCLVQERGRVHIPEWVTRPFIRTVSATHANWGEEHRAVYVAQRIAELAHTPPVRWLQNNEWPVCNDDFAVYMGELTRETLEQQHGGALQGKLALQAIIAEARPDWETSDEATEWEWEQLGNFVAVFKFHCPETKGDIHIVQMA